MTEPPLDLSELEKRRYAGITLHGKPCCFISLSERDRLVAALRGLSTASALRTGSSLLAPEYLRRCGIVDTGAK